MIILLILISTFGPYCTQVVLVLQMPFSWIYLIVDILFGYCIAHVTFGLRYVILDYLTVYTTGEFQALHMIVVVVFGVVD